MNDTTNQTGPVIITAATSDPVTLAEAKAYCLADDGQDADAVITSFITAATDYVQRRVGQQFLAATLLQTWDFFDGCELTLDRRPVSAISFVKYYDTDGTLQTISSANYWTALRSRPPRIAPVFGYIWPITQYGRPEAVQVQYVVGYASAAAVPSGLLVAIKALVKHWYDQRGPVLINGAIPKDVPKHLEDLILLHDQTGYR